MSHRNKVPTSDLASTLDTASPAKGVQPSAGASSVSPTFAPPVTGTNICVIGGGFVGLVSAAGFAEFGHSVVCVEKDLGRLKELQAGRVPFYENELGDLIRVNLENGRLSFSNDLAASLKGQKAIFIAVGTPAAESGRTDLGALEDLIVSMAGELTKGQIVVLKSTVPVGTAERVRAMLSSNGASNKQIPVISNPEFQVEFEFSKWITFRRYYFNMLAIPTEPMSQSIKFHG
ncbi:MAG: UDP-glucose/GDP-mannose dehydrogenase family protein, partial [candidate division Zixibacteria bacterium]|nr:UDP-glucose/GDP-mannose dehydrogenase family protein [candidate division Zixibacteria bacterium]